MVARSHVDRGQLFGMDGRGMFIEQTLDQATTEWDVHCACGWEGQSSAGYKACPFCGNTVTVTQ